MVLSFATGGFSSHRAPHGFDFNGSPGKTEKHPEIKSHFLVGGFDSTHLNHMLVKMGSSSPRIRDENKTYLSCHHLVFFAIGITEKIPVSVVNDRELEIWVAML